VTKTAFQGRSTMAVSGPESIRAQLQGYQGH
jgi:hypothetical protein